MAGRDAHINQPGGRFKASGHPAIAGRERELRAMADAVRRLVRITIENTASAEETADAAARIDALADALAPLVRGEPPPRYGGEVEEPHDIFPYDPVLGLYNPLALPIEMEWEPPRAVGHAVFDIAYEGPPGCVHGAILASAFDQVFNVANIHSGVAGPTAWLRMDYRAPSRLGVPLRFEAWIDSVDGRKVTTKGCVRDGDTVTVEAEGLFIAIDRERVMKLSDPG